jgi:hypothetical protein
MKRLIGSHPTRERLNEVIVIFVFLLFFDFFGKLRFISPLKNLYPRNLTAIFGYQILGVHQ